MFAFGCYGIPQLSFKFKIKWPVFPGVSPADSASSPKKKNTTRKRERKSWEDVFRNVRTHSELWHRGKAAAAWDKSGSCKNILRDCCEILKSHLLGIEFLMTLNENGAVKVFLSCASPSFYNPTETSRRHGRVVKTGLMEMNGTMWKSHFIGLY